MALSPEVDLSAPGWRAVVAELNRIAEETLGRDLIDRKSDRLDFKEHGPHDLLRALATAYMAGRSAAFRDFTAAISEIK